MDDLVVGVFSENPMTFLAATRLYKPPIPYIVAQRLGTHHWREVLLSSPTPCFLRGGGERANKGKVFDRANDKEMAREIEDNFY